MEIRVMAPEEAREVASLVSGCFLASPVFAGIDEARYLPEPIAKAMGCGQTFVAKGDHIVGSITLFPPDPDSPCETIRDHPSFGLLAVHRDHSGRGIARCLIERVEREAGEWLALSVTQRGRELIALYRRLGYEEVGAFHWPNAVDPSLIMRKRLGGGS